ncbi:hypothetical protein GCM10009527_070300 [Actinomadura nitritigenes]|uniref:Thiol:disulfide interchange protein DsbD N-terminal domain-containing protein n=1 Tax=Actinomadura nitritigenes TaxID=134602 RepID=A0ABS3QXM8_9ACTN|nr:hypothetical protein [Actinomadura nitritigenes]MBO2438750.1 hypothetical protein [Actinomadura nitritigenes]
MRWAILVALVLLVGGCGGHKSAPERSTRFTEGGVEVSVSVTDTAVKAVYRPLRPGFYVYSVDLPAGGVDGLGVATRLDVRGGLTATGRSTADRPVRTLVLPSLGVSLPVYPDGPVTLSLPVRKTGRSAEVVISYAACSSGTCLPPVTDHVTRVAFG